jgi:hypothetical protein
VFEQALAPVLAWAEACDAGIVAWHARLVAFALPSHALLPSLAELARDSTRLACFGVGVAGGALSVVVEAGARVALGTGSALETATALAALAQAGELIVDAELGLDRDGSLALEPLAATAPVRGMRLDWARLPRPQRTPTLLAETPFMSALRLDPVPAVGTVALLIARPGQGGSRWLRESDSSRSALFVRARTLGEPLGGLRLAFEAARAARPVQLSGPHEALLESLLSGEGMDSEAAQDLVVAWADASASRLVLIDDADRVDADTLEAIAGAAERGALGIVARVLEHARPPVALQSLPAGAVWSLPSLDEPAAQELVCAFAADSVEGAIVPRWVRRAGGSRLALEHVVRLAFESGELLREEESVASIRGNLRLGGRPPRHWIAQRLERLNPDERAFLEALAVHGGAARPEEVEALLEGAEQAISVRSLVATLTAGGWLEPLGPDVIALASTTVRDVLEDRLSSESLALWQRVAIERLVESERPLAIVSAATRAVLAGHDAAETLLRRASATARAAGLERTADALQLTGEQRELRPLATRGMLSGRPVLSPAFGRAKKAEGEAGGIGDAVQHLTRGDTGAALRLLRAAKERARHRSLAEQCRAALGYGVGLAAAGRATDALLEALEGLACARRGGDLRGERACARFVAQLTQSSGQSDVASRWWEFAE